MTAFFHKIRSSLSTKVAFIVTIPILLFMTYHFQEHLREDRDLLYHNAESQLLRVGEMMKEAADFSIEKNDFIGFQSLVERMSKSADLAFITLYNPHGKVLSCNKTQWISRDMQEMFSEEFSARDLQAIKKALQGGYSAFFDEDDFQYCMVMPIKIGGAGNGALYLSMDLKSTQENVRKRALSILKGSLFALIFTIVALYVLFHYFFTRRLQAVSTAAVRLASGDLTSRTKVGGTDEIGYLAASFDVLADDITNWRNNLEEMVASRVKEISTLFEVVDTISKSLELDKVLPKVLERVLENMGEGKGAVVLVSDEGNTLRLAASHGLSEESIHLISIQGQGCVGDVILKNSSLRIPGEDEDSEDASHIPGLEHEGIRSALVVPISMRGAALGVIALYSEKKDRFSEQDEVLLMTIGSQVGVAVENAQLYEKTLVLAQKDGLTGLANRRFYMETLKQETSRAVRYSTPFCLLMLDIDKFKRFNDSFGHPKGDELLREFSALVRNTVRTADTPGRYGGEEFSVILPNTTLKGAIVIAERIRTSMEDLKIPVSGESSYAGATVSIGIAELAAGETEEKLLSRADAALYRAKESGRNRVAW